MAAQVEFTETVKYIHRAPKTKPKEFDTKEASEASLTEVGGGTLHEQHVLMMKGPMLKAIGIQSGKTKLVCKAEEIAGNRKSLTDAIEVGPNEFKTVYEAMKHKKASSTTVLNREVFTCDAMRYSLRGPAPLAVSTRKTSTPAWAIKLVWKEKNCPTETITNNEKDIKDIWAKICEATDEDKIDLFHESKYREQHECIGQEGDQFRVFFHKVLKRFTIWYVDGQTLVKNSKSTVTLPSKEHADKLTEILVKETTNQSREHVVMDGLRTAKTLEMPVTTDYLANAMLCQLCISENVPDPGVVKSDGVCWAHRLRLKNRTTGQMKRKSAHLAYPVGPLTTEELQVALKICKSIIFSNAEDLERGEDTYAGKRIAKLKEHGFVDIPLFGNQVHSNSDGTCTNTVKTMRTKCAMLWLQSHVDLFVDAYKNGVKLFVAGKNAKHITDNTYQSKIDEFLKFPAPLCLREAIATHGGELKYIPHYTNWAGEIIGREAVETLPGILGLDAETFNNIVQGAHVGKKARTSKKKAGDKR